MHNVIIFGEAGCGKSSIVNMIIGEEIAEVSGSPLLCTFQSKCYKTSVDGTAFRIYDTAGLNEGDFGRVPHWKAMYELLWLIWRLNGVSLLVYCMRGCTITRNCQGNWELFNKIICGTKVPVIAVLTGLELDGNLDDGVRRNALMEAFKAHRMFPRDLACTVSFRGSNNQYKELYEQSRQKLRTLIVAYHRSKPWQMKKEKWLSGIVQKAHSCIPHFWKAFEPAFDVFVEEIGMPEGEAERLKETLRLSI